MLRRAIMLGIAMVLLVAAAVGAAFATGMDFSNVGALSSGESEVSQANTDYMGFVSEAEGVVAVAISFDRDLAAGSTIWVKVKVPGIPNPKNEIHGWITLGGFLDKADDVIVPLDDIIEPDDVEKIQKVTVTVAER